jgi:hypothetical protein
MESEFLDALQLDLTRDRAAGEGSATARATSLIGLPSL